MADRPNTNPHMEAHTSDPPTPPPEEEKLAIPITLHEGSKSAMLVVSSTKLSSIMAELDIKDLKALHVGSPRPSTPEPPPSTLSPAPLRYPDTLGDVITISMTEGKGFGVFAAKDIPAGSVLLCEAPLITLIDDGARSDPLDASVNALTPSQRESFHSLHAFTRKNESLNRSIVYSNGYSILNDLGTGVFETASRINHSCVPNSMFDWKTYKSEDGKQKGRMMFWNRWKLLEGEEVTVDYGHKKSQLKRIYGFDCACGGCTESGSGSNGMSSSGSESGEIGEMPSIDGVLEGKLEDSEKAFL